jgi:hypothetical protein
MKRKLAAVRTHRGGNSNKTHRGDNTDKTHRGGNTDKLTGEIIQINLQGR